MEKHSFAVMDDDAVLEIGNLRQGTVHLHKNGIPTEIDRMDTGTSYNEFFCNYLRLNKPCIIPGVSKGWESDSNWYFEGKINYSFFKSNYGDLIAPIADCTKIEFNSQKKVDMTVNDYMEYLECDKKEKILYLKDWHLRKQLPNHEFYTVPKYFASDWLNEYALDKNEDDFMFVYIGPKFSWTPFHVDVYNSYSWSVNVAGKKKWLFLPPGEEKKLGESPLKLPVDVTEKLNDDINYVEIIQQPGDAIFVPSGWHHQVYNLEDTISINHNWVNGCNIIEIWESLKSNLVLVENEIIEFKEDDDFGDQCQKMLKAFHGMDYQMFLEFLAHISEKRYNTLMDNLGFQSFGTYEFGYNHLKFDLHAIKAVVDCMLEDKNVTEDNKLSEGLDQIKENVSI